MSKQQEKQIEIMREALLDSATELQVWASYASQLDDEGISFNSANAAYETVLEALGEL